MKNTAHKKIFYEILRFILVGGGATIVDFVSMSLVLYIMQPNLYPSFIDVFFGVNIHPSTLSTVLGTGIGFIIGLVFNYVLSVFFVYEEKGNSKTVKGFIIFAILSFIGFLIHILGMYIGYDLWHWNEWILKILLTGVVLIYNYVTRKIFVFKKVKQKEENIVKNN